MAAMIPRITTWDEVQKLLREGKELELRLALNYGVYSRYTLSADNESDKIFVEMHIDDSTYKTTFVKFLTKGNWAKGFQNNAVYLLEVS